MAPLGKLENMDLNESRLGRQEYWDKFYETEIRNFNENPQDTGEVWFSDSGAEDRVIDFLSSRIEEEGINNVTVVDLGTGNGRFLFGLRDAGINGCFLGIDYAPTSVELSTQIAHAEGYKDIGFRHVDFLSDPDWIAQKFDIVHDKGTLDAIALSGEPGVTLKYAQRVGPVTGRMFVITSCNFTESELRSLLDPVFSGWKVESLPYPTFTFGGAKGSAVVTLVYTAPN